MTKRLILPTFALGILLAGSAWGQHHAMVGKVDYEPNPRGGDPNAPAGCVGVQAKVEISGTATAFSPATVTVDAGQPVCWTWSGTAHNITSDDLSFTSGLPAEVGTFQTTFRAPGTYGYHCQVHGTPTTGMRGTVVVREADGGGGSGPGTLELASAAYTVDENAGALTVAVNRTGGSEGAASVKYSVSPGTAKPGKDYLPKTGTLKWTNGDQEPKSFAVPLKNDTALEANEGFTLKLAKATGAALGTSSAAVTIHDDDNPCGSALLAPSQLRASGRSDSEIHLTWDNEPAAASAVRIERRQPGEAFQEIVAVPAGVNGFTDAGLPGGTLFQYRVRAQGAQGLSVFSSLAAGATDGPTMPCERNALCLQNGRFEATVQWRPSAEEPARDAKRVALPDGPDSGGLFTFSPQEDLQLLLNVVDGCSVNDRYWLNFAALTDVELTVKVRDTLTGRTWVYFNPAGSAPAPVRDVEAFATCP